MTDVPNAVQCFELGPYNHLTKRTKEQEETEARAQEAKDRTASDWLQQLQLHTEDIKRVFDELIVAAGKWFPTA